MKFKFFVRKAHRYLGIFIAIQLVFWTASGTFFALVPITKIRGEHLVHSAPQRTLGDQRLVSPNALLGQPGVDKSIGVDRITLATRLGVPVYLVTTEDGIAAFDARSGMRLPALDEAGARSVASARTNLDLTAASLVTRTSDGDEYRGGELPAWRVVASDGTHLYIGAHSGKLRAVRTSNWRLYDFLWGLHIMDWQGREDFNHWLLKGAASLALLSVLAGVLVFIQSARLKRRGTRAA